MSEWQPIETAPVETAMLIWGRGGISSAVGDPYMTVGELDHARLYAIDYAERGCDCVRGRTIWEPLFWMPLPQPPA